MCNHSFQPPAGADEYNSFYDWSRKQSDSRGHQRTMSGIIFGKGRVVTGGGGAGGILNMRRQTQVVPAYTHCDSNRNKRSEVNRSVPRSVKFDKGKHIKGNRSLIDTNLHSDPSCSSTKNAYSIVNYQPMEAREK